MLNTDMVIAFPAATAETISPAGATGQACGGRNIPQSCTATTPAAPAALALDTAQSFRNSNTAFLTQFAASYVKMTSVGYGPSGRLGSSLTSIDINNC